MDRFAESPQRQPRPAFSSRRPPWLAGVKFQRRGLIHANDDARRNKILCPASPLIGARFHSLLMPVSNISMSTRLPSEPSSALLSNAAVVSRILPRADGFVSRFACSTAKPRSDRMKPDSAVYSNAAVFQYSRTICLCAILTEQHAKEPVTRARAQDYRHTRVRVPPHLSSQHHSS